MMIVGKKVEELIARLAQRKRAAPVGYPPGPGDPNVPSVDVHHGLDQGQTFPAGSPSRCRAKGGFAHHPRSDGRRKPSWAHGDMLYLPSGTSMAEHELHGAFVPSGRGKFIASLRLLKKSTPPDYVDEVFVRARRHPFQASRRRKARGGAAEDPEADALYDEAGQGLSRPSANPPSRTSSGG